MAPLKSDPRDQPIRSLGEGGHDEERRVRRPVLNFLERTG